MPLLCATDSTWAYADRPGCIALASSSAPTWCSGRMIPRYGRPPTNARPAVGASRPRMIRIVVVFPAPFGPRKPVTCPGRTVKLRRSTAVSGPNLLVSSSTSIMAGTRPAGRGAPAGRSRIGPRNSGGPGTPASQETRGGQGARSGQGPARAERFRRPHRVVSLAEGQVDEPAQRERGADNERPCPLGQVVCPMPHQAGQAEGIEGQQAAGAGGDCCGDWGGHRVSPRPE